MSNFSFGEQDFKVPQFTPNVGGHGGRDLGGKCSIYASKLDLCLHRRTCQWDVDYNFSLFLSHLINAKGLFKQGNEVRLPIFRLKIENILICFHWNFLGLYYGFKGEEHATQTAIACVNHFTPCYRHNFRLVAK